MTTTDVALLAGLENANVLLEQARTVDELKSVRDMAEAARLYAKKARLGLEAQNHAAEIKLRAERRAGELLAEMPKQDGGDAKRKSLGNSVLPSDPPPPTIAEIGVGKMQSSRWQQVAAMPEDAFETHIARTVDSSRELTTADLLRRARRLPRTVDVAASLPSPAADDCRLLVGDFRTALDNLADGSVDAIVTDPPYPREYLPLFDDLGRISARLLKQGGSLVVMTGQSYLPDILAALSRHLTYQWTLAYLTPGGQSPQIFQRKVNTFWKPLLWFVREPYAGAWVGDVIRTPSNDNDKRFHSWGQGEVGFSEIVARFSQPGHRILDPFLGGGTTALAAVDQDRRFIGLDIDAACVETTRARLSGLKAA